MRSLVILTVLFLGLGSACLADDVFVANKPFKGQIYGVGSEVRVSIVDLGQALNLAVEHGTQGWLLSGKPVTTTEEHGVVWIDIDDFPEGVVRVVRNRDLGSIDLYRGSVATATPSQGRWGGNGTLVMFGASWDPVTTSMQATMSQLERSQSVKIVTVDVEQMESPAYQQYDYLFEGTKTPYFVLLDGSGRKLHSFAGFATYSEMLTILSTYIKL